MVADKKPLNGTGRSRPVDSVSPIVVATPPPPTTPLPARKKSVHGVADDALPQGLFLRDRNTPMLANTISRSPLNATVSETSPLQLAPTALNQLPPPAASVPIVSQASTAKQVVEMDQFDRQIRSNVTATQLPRERIEHIVKATMGNDNSRRAFLDDVRRLLSEKLGTVRAGSNQDHGRSPQTVSPSRPANTSPQTATSYSPRDDAIQRFVKYVYGCTSGRSEASPTSQPAHLVSAPHTVSEYSSVEQEIASIVSSKRHSHLPSAHSDPQRLLQNICAPKPSSSLVAKDVAALEGLSRPTRKKIIRSTHSAFSDATTETQSDLNNSSSSALPRADLCVSPQRRGK